MKRVLSIVLASLLAGSLSISPSMTLSANAAAPRPGASCSKVGAAVKTSTRIFTCKVVAKKKVWTVRALSSRPVNTTPKPSSPTMPIRDEAQLQAISACKLQNYSPNLFRLGLPAFQVAKDPKNIRVAAIPIVFEDSDKFLVSDNSIIQTFSNISNTFNRESFGRIKVSFSGLPGDKTREFPPISLDVKAEGSPFMGARGSRIDMNFWLNKVTSKTGADWNLSSYDAVAFYFKDFRPNNFYGGQAWRGQEGNSLEQYPLQTPSGKLSAWTFSNPIESVVTHELAHSLFGLIDLYTDIGSQTYSNYWGLMSAAYSGGMNIFGWEKYVAGWITDDEVLCGKRVTDSFIQFSHLKTAGSRLMVYPLDAQRAVVMESIDLSEVPIEVAGKLIPCSIARFCANRSGVGLLAYELDVEKLSALGAIKVPKELTYPNLITGGNSLSVAGKTLKNLGCDALGCRVEIVD